MTQRFWEAHQSGPNQEKGNSPKYLKRGGERGGRLNIRNRHLQVMET